MLDSTSATRCSKGATKAYLGFESLPLRQCLCGFREGRLHLFHISPAIFQYCQAHQPQMIVTHHGPKMAARALILAMNSQKGSLTMSTNAKGAKRQW